MNANQRHKDKPWQLPTLPDGRIESWDYVKIAVLMDIRDELKALNGLLRCHNFMGFPFTLKQILTETRGARRDRKKKGGRAAA